MSANPLSVRRGQVSASAYGNWIQNLPNLADRYRSNQPAPHINIPELLDPDVALRMATEFPSADDGAWTRYRHFNEDKFGLTDWTLFPPSLQQAVVSLNSPFFISLLCRLTGIPGLLPDPGLEGGGLHLCRRGGYLNLHTDFSTHHYNPGWRRRVNLILYLNPCWSEAWGGAIEFWDRAVQRRFAKYPPILNHAVIFNTDAPALHGFPDPLACPQNVVRKSLALYYYTMDASPKGISATDYYPRPNDGVLKKFMVWLDKKAVSLYSRGKARFKFSDQFASRILRFFSGR